MWVATDKYKILENILLVFQITTLLVGITCGGKGVEMQVYWMKQR